MIRLPGWALLHTRFIQYRIRPVHCRIQALGTCSQTVPICHHVRIHDGDGRAYALCSPDASGLEEACSAHLTLDDTALESDWETVDGSRYACCDLDGPGPHSVRCDWHRQRRRRL
ncbi:MAG: hypothetical protein ACOCXJ_02725 [Planctomycetota bacterium]